MSAETLALLQEFIVRPNASTLDEKSQTRLRHHLQKLVKAAEVLIVKSALQQDQIQSLCFFSNEAKIRRVTKSTVLGKAKAMSYEDIQEARAKRVEKETRAEEKRRRKCTETAAAEVVDTDSEGGQRLWQAPVAKMW